MLGSSDTSWNAARTFLGNRGVLDQILDYDPRKLGKRERESLMSKITEKSNSFTK